MFVTPSVSEIPPSESVCSAGADGFAHQGFLDLVLAWGQVQVQVLFHSFRH